MLNDVLRGGAGNDTLSGGYAHDGANDLKGGKGADHFVFPGEVGDTVVRDFEAGLDLLVIDAAMMGALGPGIEAAAAAFVPDNDTPEYLLAFHAAEAGGRTVLSLWDPVMAGRGFTVTLDGVADKWSLLDSILIVLD